MRHIIVLIMMLVGSLCQAMVDPYSTGKYVKIISASTGSPTFGVPTGQEVLE